MRQELEFPTPPRPRCLTEREAQIVIREIARGASEHQLAAYFDVTILTIRNAVNMEKERIWYEENDG